MATKHLYYDKHTKFQINPVISKSDIVDLNQYITDMPQNDNFFWNYDSDTNTIIINNNNKMVEDNIFAQLINIYHWLHQKGYRLTGSTFYRTNDFIEYISIDDIISRYIFFDEINLHHNNLLVATKNKIIAKLKNQERIAEKEFVTNNSGGTCPYENTQYTNNTHTCDNTNMNEYNQCGNHNNNQYDNHNNNQYDNHNNNQYDNHNNNQYDNHNSNQCDHIQYTRIQNILQEENNKIIQLLQKRLDNTESRLKSLTKKNHFVYKICGIIGLVTVSTYLFNLAFREN